MVEASNLPPTQLWDQQSMQPHTQSHVERYRLETRVRRMLSPRRKRASKITPQHRSAVQHGLTFSVRAAKWGSVAAAHQQLNIRTAAIHNKYRLGKKERKQGNQNKRKSSLFGDHKYKGKRNRKQDKISS